MQLRAIFLAAAALTPSAEVMCQEPPSGSLQVNPQQGATPPPIELGDQSPDISPSALETSQDPAVSIQQAPLLAPPPFIANVEQDLTLGSPAAVLPLPSSDPLKINRSSDPVIALAEGSVDPKIFAAAVRKGVRQHPGIAEADAERAEARAARSEARALALPVVDLNVTHFRVIDREFSDDPQNILERARPRVRTDAQFQVNAPVFDFGKTTSRIRSASERVAASTANIDDYSTRLAQSSIAAWYQVFTYRALVRLSEAFVANQDELNAALEKRVQQGVSAPADLATFNGYRAAAQAQLADFRRQLSNAEVQYSVYIGEEPPADLGRAPVAPNVDMQSELLLSAVTSLPAVERARRLARSARYDTRAAEAQLLPSLSVGVIAGRYGVFETDRDYDVRATVTLSQRLFGGAKQRADQAFAREQRLQATYDRVLLEAERDVQVAASDVIALDQSVAALRENYFAARQSRDALFERFRFARGSLNDVLTAQTNYFNVAVRFLVGVSELDISRYVLLARTGQLLAALEIEPARTSSDE